MTNQNRPTPQPRPHPTPAPRPHQDPDKIVEKLHKAFPDDPEMQKFIEALRKLFGR